MFENHDIIMLPNLKMWFVPQFYTPSVSDAFFNELSSKLAWKQGEITLFGKKIAEPRLSAWYADEGKIYTYSGKVQTPLKWYPTLHLIKKDIEKYVHKNVNVDLHKTINVDLHKNVNVDLHKTINKDVENDAFLFSDFNSVLCNLYRNGQDSMGFHADNERELGQNPLIASLNLGETRRFLFRRKDDKTVKYELLLTSGSLLIMGGETQHYWHHAVPKEPKRSKPRINLTFRHIY